jgi:hypothetical protein
MEERMKIAIVDKQAWLVRVRAALQFIREERERQLATYRALPWWRRLLTRHPEQPYYNVYGWLREPALMNAEMLLRQPDAGVVYFNEDTVDMLEFTELDAREGA